MRIVSRLKEDEMQLERLKEILEAASDGCISEHGETPPGQTLDELITQVDNVCANFMETVDTLEEDYDCLQHEVLALSAQCNNQEKMLNSIIEGARYDEALDFATTDLMDALLGAGVANSTFDGDISFDPRVTLTKDDFKPLLRQAIETWVNMKVR